MKLYLSTDISSRDLFQAEKAASMQLWNEKWGKSRYPDVSGTISFNGYGSDEVHSARRPNTRDEWERSNYYAATWDQWGVLLGRLYLLDPDMKVGGYKHPYYANADDFHRQTDGRFRDVETVRDLPDFHGDHTFRWDGVSTKCTKCSARQVWF